MMMPRAPLLLLLAASPTAWADDVDPTGLECPNCHEIHDGRSPGHNGRPPLPSNPDIIVNIDTDVLSVDGIAGYTTWRLSADIGGEVENMYALFADANHSLSLPAAYQVGKPFGADIGGTDPQMWSFKPETQYDSWLTVGSEDGSAVGPSAPLGGLTTAGIDFDSWTEKQGLEANDGAIFFLDPDASRHDWPVTLAQFTVPTGTAFSGLLNARGKSMYLIGTDPPPLVADWTVYCIAFGTDPSDVGLRTDKNGHCSQAQVPPNDKPTVPDPELGSCDEAGLDDRMKDVQDRCCTMYLGDGGQESDCEYGHMPTTCDAKCAEVFLPFWDDCQTMLEGAASADAHDDLGALATQCKAAQQADNGQITAVAGCQDHTAANYNPLATTSGSPRVVCLYGA